MAKYVGGNVAAIMGPKDFYVSILKKSVEEAVAFEEGVGEMEDELVESLLGGGKEEEMDSDMDAQIDEELEKDTEGQGTGERKEGKQ